MSVIRNWLSRAVRFRNQCRWVTLAATVSYTFVSLCWAHHLYTQNSFAYLMARINGQAPKFELLFDYNQAWKVTILSTLILGLITLPRWQGWLALATILVWEFINGILSM